VWCVFCIFIIHNVYLVVCYEYIFNDYYLKICVCVVCNVYSSVYCVRVVYWLDCVCMLVFTLCIWGFVCVWKVFYSVYISDACTYFNKLGIRVFNVHICVSSYVFDVVVYNYYLELCEIVYYECFRFDNLCIWLYYLLRKLIS